MTATEQPAKTGTSLGITSLTLGAIAFMLAGFATTWLAVVIATPALLLGILTLRKGSVKALPLIGITLSVIAIAATAALMGV